MTREHPPLGLFAKFCKIDIRYFGPLAIRPNPELIRVPYIAQEQPPPDQSNYYDEMYFDSDDSGGEGEGGGAQVTERGPQEGAAKKVKKLTNDELFYDPNMDDEDEKWVNRQRMAYHNGEVRGVWYT